ncbi:tyrosine-type recombinase/integrase [Yanshouia hominis]|uniref:Site-specific integrase n=1 Tax=Yanshouia hominis TaxID=2763673 RepID=A0ABR7NLJ3_9FIRM|nr:site-specific integrase [Yanshouia hominis]MBC8577277.1 site-specific integrase [Yanshouia hominis]
MDEVTLQGYETLAECHILPYFDKTKIRLIDVTRTTLQTYINEKREHGRMDGKGGLSTASLRLHKNILYQTLKGAVRDGLIATNPCEFVSLPQANRHENGFYTVEQLNRLFDAIKEESLSPLVKITALYGLRRSEALGLKWDSIDFEANSLTIRHTVAKVKTAVEKDKTKNASSYRSFPLTKEAANLFRAIKEQEKENQKLFGKEYCRNDYIFKWVDGRPFSTDYVSKRFNSLLKKHELPHIRFHDLRHSCASFLIAMGYSLKDVQEWLGHSDIKMTANVYAHLDISRKIGIASQLEQPFQEVG